jgi:PHD/YefM family antitoxin component YafN of YafNO toxin-antitoxin module
MTALEALESVQYVTVKGKRLAIISADEWEAMIEWLETLEDVELAKEAFAQLEAAGGDRERAGWLKWDDVKEDPCCPQKATVRLWRSRRTAPEGAIAVWDPSEHR